MYLLCAKRFYVVSNIRITIIFNFLLDELIFFHIVRCLLIFDPRNYLIFLAMQGSVKILNIQYILNVLAILDSNIFFQIQIWQYYRKFYPDKLVFFQTNFHVSDRTGKCILEKQQYRVSHLFYGIYRFKTIILLSKDITRLCFERLVGFSTYLQ